MLLYVQRDVWEDYCAGKFESDTEKLVGMACDGMRWHGGEVPRHIEASTWEAGFDYLECSYMSKGMFRKIIVRGKLRVTRRSWNGWAWHGVGWHGGGVPRHMEASTWEVGFDCLECSYMSKKTFRKIIVQGKLRVTRRSWNGWAWHGVGWHGGGVCQGTWKQVHGKLVLIVWNALICPKGCLGRLLCGEN